MKRKKQDITKNKKAPVFEIESHSEIDNAKYEWLNVSSLMETLLLAFAKHYPVILKPDDFWKAILYGFARHVEKNAEVLRDKFVSHEGKKELKVEVDHFTPGNGTVSDWELVFPQFSTQIQQNISNPELHDIVTRKFSTTTVTDQACHEIALMSSMKQYFSYCMMTCCGIPEITLEGVAQDWQDLYNRTKQLGEFMLPEFSKKMVDMLASCVEKNCEHVKWEYQQKILEPNGQICASARRKWCT